MVAERGRVSRDLTPEEFVVLSKTQTRENR